jgi:hypothetical protein
MSIYCPPSYQTDPRRVAAVAVIADCRVLVYAHLDPRRGLVPGIRAVYGLHEQTPAALVRALIEQHVAAVWILDLPPAQWRALADAVLAAPDLDAHILTADGALAGVIAQLRGADGAGHGLPLGIYHPGVQDSWGMAPVLERLRRTASSPAVAALWLAEAVMVAAYALDMQLRFSPSYTGLAMLRQEISAYEARGGELPELSAEWRERLSALRPTYAVWRTPSLAALVGQAGLTDQRDAVLIWAYDRNGSYVSSAREVPVGDPLPTPVYQPQTPGVYRLSVLAAPEAPADRVPGPFHAGASAGAYPTVPPGELWAWEPQVRLAIQRGYALHIHEGWYWPKGRRGEGGRAPDLLRAWQARIWSARRAARAIESPAGRIAEALVKRCGVSAIGRLVQRQGEQLMETGEARRRGLRILWRETDERGEPTGRAQVVTDLGRTDLVQPGWWSQIISLANAALWRALYTYASRDTVLAYVDGLYTLAPHPELEHDRDQPGHMRGQGRIAVPRTDLARLDGLGPHELIKALARHARGADEDEGDADGA